MKLFVGTHHAVFTAAGALLALTTAVQAQGIVVQTTNVTIANLGPGGEVDFGSGLHVGTIPSGAGRVTYSYGTVNGQLVATARVTGTLYWDALAAGCPRLTIEFLDLNNLPLATRTVQPTECPMPGFNANSPDNQVPVNEPFSSTNLHSVRIRAFDISGLIPVAHGSATVLAPRARNHLSKINNSETDFGLPPHQNGSPVGSATIAFNRTNGLMSATVTGTIFWDSLNPFFNGVARLVIDYQDATGVNLPNTTRTFNLSGTGCCASFTNNQLPIAPPTVSSGRLWRVRLRIGKVVGGAFTDVVTKVIDYNGVGLFELSPAESIVGIHEPSNYAISWTVPDTLNWHDLDLVEIRLRDEEGTALWIVFDESDSSFSLVNDSTGHTGRSYPGGSKNRLQSPEAVLDLADTGFLGSGPDGPTVTLNLSLSFKPQASGRTFSVEVAASDDEGNATDFAEAGILTVAP